MNPTRDVALTGSEALVSRESEFHLFAGRKKQKKEITRVKTWTWDF